MLAPWLCIGTEGNVSTPAANHVAPRTYLLRLGLGLFKMLAGYEGGVAPTWPEAWPTTIIAALTLNVLYFFT